MTAFTDCMQSIKERMDKIRAKMALGLEEDEIDPALEVRGSRMMEQIASLKEEVANVRESKYILSEEDISSIEIECPPRAPELFDAMMAAQKKVDDIVEEARELAARVEAEEEKRRVEEEERREEEEKKIKPPPDAPTAPKGTSCSHYQALPLVTNCACVQRCLSAGHNVLPPLNRSSRSRSPGDELGLGLPSKDRPPEEAIPTNGGHTTRKACLVAAIGIRHQIPRDVIIHRASRKTNWRANRKVPPKATRTVGPHHNP